MILFLFSAFTVMIWLDLPKLIKEKSKKDIAIFCILYIIAFIVAFLQVKGVDIPSPVKALRYLMEDVMHLNFENLY